MVKKPYESPRMYRHNSEPDCSHWPTSGLEEIRLSLDSSPSAGFDLKPQLATVVDNDRRFLEVSDDFCNLVGYTREELLGMRYDDVTAPNTNDIPTILGQFLKLGYLHGLWMLVSREGTRILVRFDSWVRPDSCIEGHMQVVGAGY